MAGPQGVSGGFADAFERLSLAARNALKVSTTRATIGTTPRQAIWTLNKATLYRYTPKLPPEERHPVPLVLVFALMNKAAILDLRPGNSFVEHMLEHPDRRTAISGSKITCSSTCPARSGR